MWDIQQTHSGPDVTLNLDQILMIQHKLTTDSVNAHWSGEGHQDVGEPCVSPCVHWCLELVNRSDPTAKPHIYSGGRC